jgi:HAMP domain-containing protein
VVLLLGLQLGAMFSLWMWITRAQRQLELLRERIARLEAAQADVLGRAEGRTIDTARTR